MKQAIILIHGVGEQVPMDTLRGFVEAVWTTDPSVIGPGRTNQVWSKPDEISRNFELRRLTTAENTRGQRTDFFEYYWADLMADTKLAQVAAWVWVLLLRSPRRIPGQLRGLWWAVWVLGLGVLALWLNHFQQWWPEPAGLRWLYLWGAPVLWAALSWVLIHFAGDAARYLHVAPANIQSRRQIRETGVQLVQELHASGKYDRIVVVGHSLGTVIGYDILTQLWARHNDAYVLPAASAASPALEVLEQLARSQPAQPSAAYAQACQAAQADYAAELRARGNRWLVTDFVTLGSPLAHATFLMAKTPAAFGEKKTEREFPTCLPALEDINGQRQFSYANAAGIRLPHHAAVFGPVRWTNLYFPCRWTLWGDVIGGPAGPAFGPGVKDIPVETSLNGGVFTHTCYWDLPRPLLPNAIPSHIRTLRDSLKL